MRLDCVAYKTSAAHVWYDSMHKPWYIQGRRLQQRQEGFLKSFFFTPLNCNWCRENPPLLVLWNHLFIKVQMREPKRQQREAVCVFKEPIYDVKYFLPVTHWFLFQRLPQFTLNVLSEKAKKQETHFWNMPIKAVLKLKILWSPSHIGKEEQPMN